MSTLGDRVEQLRTATGFRSIRALSEAANVPYSVLYNIIKGVNTNPTTDTLQAIAGALKIPLSELMGDEQDQSQGDSWAWFWRSRFATLPISEILEMRYAGPEHRALWCLKELLGYRPLNQIAELLEEPAAHLTALLAGRDKVSSNLIDKLVARCEAPKNWLVAGSPPVIDEMLSEILNHPQGGAYLLEVHRAMQARIMPELLARQIDTLIMAINNRPSAT